MPQLKNSHDLVIPSWELTYPLPKVLLKMIFLFPGWDMCSFRGGKKGVFRLQIQSTSQDLVKETQGPAGLILAAHPEVICEYPTRPRAPTKTVKVKIRCISRTQRKVSCTCYILTYIFNPDLSDSKILQFQSPGDEWWPLDCHPAACAAESRQRGSLRFCHLLSPGGWGAGVGPVSRCCYPRHPWISCMLSPRRPVCRYVPCSKSLPKSERTRADTKWEDSMIRYGESDIERDMNKLLLLAVHLAFLFGWWKWSTRCLQVLCWPPFRWGQTCSEGAVDVSTGRSCSGWHFPSLCGDPCASMKLEAGSWKVRWLGWCPQSEKQLCRNGPDSTAAAMIKKGGLSWKCYGWLLEPR